MLSLLQASSEKWNAEYAEHTEVNEHLPQELRHVYNHLERCSLECTFSTDRLKRISDYNVD